MSEQIISKRCGKCKEIKPISEFFKRSYSRDGLQNNCKACHLKYQKEYRRTKSGKAANRNADLRRSKSEKRKASRKRHQQSEKGKARKKHYRQSKEGKTTTKYYKIRHPNRIKAIRTVNSAIRAGRLSRPDSLQCHYCPAQAKEYHHYKSYAPEHWLDVVPVCIPCHNKISKNKVISATV